MIKAPTKIRCSVQKKSRWQRLGDNAILKSVSFYVTPGRYYGYGDEENGRMESGLISLFACDEVECFFDGFRVGQIVEIEIKPADPETTEGL